MNMNDGRLNGLNHEDMKFMDAELKGEENNDFMLIDKAINQLFNPDSGHESQQENFEQSPPAIQ